jgi:hypothetical protein
MILGLTNPWRCNYCSARGLYHVGFTRDNSILEKVDVCVFNLNILQKSHSAMECVFQGSYAGNAAGFKLNTLPKLLDTRANKPRMTFLHFVVQVAETNNKDALAFIKDLSNISNICKYVSACMSWLWKNVMTRNSGSSCTES